MPKLKRLFLTFFLFSTAFLFSATFSPTFAQGEAVMESIIRYFARTAVGVAGGFALLLLIFGGIKYVTSAGQPDEIKEAQSVITAAIIGLLVILCSALILNTMGTALGLPGW